MAKVITRDGTELAYKDFAFNTDLLTFSKA
jgi:hypothetical protein